MPAVTTIQGLDWYEFSRTCWDQRPVLVTGLRQPPFVEPDALRAAVRAAAPTRPAAMSPNAQFTIGRRQQVAPGEFLPTDADQDFTRYHRRLAELLGGERYALVCNCLHAFDYPLWAGERAFYVGLWEHLGLPSSTAITTLFHGTYEHSPVGVHRDRFATFMYVLNGRKRMRFWPDRPWTEELTTKLDYQEHLAESFVAEVDAGDLLYWPARYYHVGESIDAEPATSVNVGIRRAGLRAEYVLDDFLTDCPPAVVVDQTAVVEQLPTMSGSLYALGPDRTGRLPSGLPAALREASGYLREIGGERRSRERTALLELRHWGAAGFAPVPPPAEPRPLDDDTLVSASPDTRLRWTELDGASCYCAANGHVVRTSARPVTLRRLVDALHGAEPVRVGDLLAGARPGPPGQPGTPSASREGLRSLLVTLETFRGIVRVP
jgi:50S ribosomal protein L16 3-hydroxylase